MSEISDVLHQKSQKELEKKIDLLSSLSEQIINDLLIIAKQIDTNFEGLQASLSSLEKRLQLCEQKLIPSPIVITNTPISSALPKRIIPLSNMDIRKSVLLELKDVFDRNPRVQEEES